MTPETLDTRNGTSDVRTCVTPGTITWVGVNVSGMLWNRMGSPDEVVGNVSVLPEGCNWRFIKDFLGGGLRLKSFCSVWRWCSWLGYVSGMICKNKWGAVRFSFVRWLKRMTSINLSNTLESRLSNVTGISTLIKESNRVIGDTFKVLVFAANAFDS